MGSNFRLNGASLMRDMTLNVYVDTRELGVRLWFAKKLLRLAASVLGCQIKVEVNGQ